MDLDNTCGQNCDPQTCDFTANPPACTPAPNPGLSSTLTAPAGNGSFGDVTAVDTTFACDPLLPGPTEICVLVSDGDTDCDQTRCITIQCPDLCEGVVCDDGNECTRDRCDSLTGLCGNDPAPDGIACDNCNSSCQLGVCDAGSPFVADFVFAGTVAIDGVLQQVNTTYVNPYSGASIAANGLFYANQSSFLGTSTFDTLAGSGLQDIVLARLPSGAQAICGVERVFSLNSFDILGLADEFIVLGDMTIDGGNEGDVLWANAGNDLLRGSNGDDWLDGGPGNDNVEGQTGNDTITLWPGSGFDSISGGNGSDQVVVSAERSQITITAAANLSYEFDIFYLGTPMAEIREVELLDMNGTIINLATCTGGAADVCNLCGNDALDGGEGCDDGNNVNGDGCAADCTAEY
jgi:cysteine-rich repeat protein